MKNIKQVTWDKRPLQGLVGNQEDCLPLDFNRKVEIKMKVSSVYQGNKVHLKILEETSDNKYIATITGFEKHGTTYKDIAIDDKVYIDREYICWLMP
ncbi:MAG: hypothetical protein ACUZ8N_06840 [Candidatus Scalindua sp.]